MRFSEQDLEAVINDESKLIDHDLVWRDDQNHFPAKLFRAKVATESGYPLFACGRYNRKARKLSFALIYGGVGRIYALDLGVGHRNPTGELLRDKHKHRWSVSFRDKVAYVPDDITAPWDQPVRAWEQFCAEAKLFHTGTLTAPTDPRDLPQ